MYEGSTYTLQLLVDILNKTLPVTLATHVGHFFGQFAHRNTWDLQFVEVLFEVGVECQSCQSQKFTMDWLCLHDICHSCGPVVLRPTLMEARLQIQYIPSFSYAFREPTNSKSDVFLENFQTSLDHTPTHPHLRLDNYITDFCCQNFGKQICNIICFGSKILIYFCTCLCHLNKGSLPMPKVQFFLTLFKG